MIAFSSVNLEEVIENSFRNFHVKGFDYLCLKRTPQETVKVYFFEGDVADAPEAVIPHDHRYPFSTDCLAGSVVNHEFVELFGKRYRDEGQPYERFLYSTPLNGGDGFVWDRDAWLFRTASRAYGAGEGYLMRHDRLHTITIKSDTVLGLVQFADVVPVGQPTIAFRPSGLREPPNLSGLYDRMTTDHAIARLRTLSEITGIPWSRAQ